MKTKPPHRRQTRRRFLSGLALLAVGGPVYARFMEPTWLEISRHQIQVGRDKRLAPLKILHLSDLHASPVVSLKFIEKAIQLGLDWAPDLICLTGDFITWKFDRFDRYAEILSTITQRAPAFACLGNHDGGTWASGGGGYPDTTEVRALLARSRIELLHNSARTLQRRDWNIRLIGLGDPWAGEFTPQTAFAAAQPTADGVTVVLSHNPDTKDALKFHAWDLMLSGHTHGGQFCLPLLGTLFAPVQDRRYVKGLHRWNNRWLHITKGIGNVLGLRFNCRPEISLLTLT